jgi:hypothetical protein
MKKIRLGNQGFAIVDDEDFEALSRYCWWKAGTRKSYAQRREGKHGKTFYMAREIMHAPEHLWVDHINGDTLDNRKCNLRLCTKRQNTRHAVKKRHGVSSVYKGVSFRPELKKRPWMARIMTNLKQEHLGMFETEHEAAIAYNEAARKYHGEFALLNEI